MRRQGQPRPPAPVFLLGMPRSGTSWLSQIVESSPACAVRLSPSFSYPLKHRLRMESTEQDWRDVLRAAHDSDDPFMTQNYRRDTGELGRFREKEPSDIRLLAIKDTRFHGLYLDGWNKLKDAKLVYIVRHPAACLWSWRCCKEFPADADFLSDWRSGACRKRGEPRARAGEYWGFEDWKALTRRYLSLAESDPKRVHVMHYERLVADAEAETEALFSFLAVPLTGTTRRFLRDSQSHHDPRPYAVYKDRSVARAWRGEFPTHVLAQIEAETREPALAPFVTAFG